MPLHAGDAVLLPHGSSHVIASAANVPSVDFEQLARVPVADDLYLVRGDATDGGAASSVIFCGALRFNLDPLHPLLAMMPDVMHAGALGQRDPTVPGLLEAMEREVALDRIGACGILARLADVLAASIIRAWVECGCSDSTGWIAAVQCPRIGDVMAAIHAEPERDWSVPVLAQADGHVALHVCRSVHPHRRRHTRQVRDQGEDVPGAPLDRARRHARDYRRAQARLTTRKLRSVRAFKRVIGELPGAARREHALSQGIARVG